MKFLEKDLEQIIYEAEKSELHDRGLCIGGKTLRQLRIGNYGIADLVTIERPYKLFDRLQKGTITVYELKQESISVSAFFQALRYAKGIKRYISEYYTSIEDYFNFRIVLIGSSYSGDVVYLSDFFPHYGLDKDSDDTMSTTISLYQYSYNIDGIRFNELYDYKLTNEGF